MSVARRLEPYGTTIFTEMTALAGRCGAVNLAQGFPDFDGPDWVQAAACEAMRQGHNQYARMPGLPVLCQVLADRWHAATGLACDPLDEITVTSGCTEGLAATFLGLLNPGDAVVLFEPYYDSYHACVAMAGGVVRTVPLHPPPAPAASLAAADAFWFDPDDLRRAFSPPPRLIVVNTPHNPTGKVFTGDELALIAALCTANGTIAVTDEVYEHLTFEPDQPHRHLATFPGMAECTITLSSLGKTFSLTGWKVGWAIAARELTRAVRAAHQFLVFCTPPALQLAAAAALRDGAVCVVQLRARLHQARDFLCATLGELGFEVYRPAGTYFIMADHSAVSRRLGIDPPDDVALCRRLTEQFGVAAIPPSVFYEDPARGRHLVRFAFCKRMETLHAAAERLRRLTSV